MESTLYVYETKLDSVTSLSFYVDEDNWIINNNVFLNAIFVYYVNVCKNIHSIKKNAWFTSDDNNNRLYSKSVMVFQ